MFIHITLGGVNHSFLCCSYKTMKACLRTLTRTVLTRLRTCKQSRLEVQTRSRACLCVWGCVRASGVWILSSCRSDSEASCVRPAASVGAMLHFLSPAHSLKHRGNTSVFVQSQEQALTQAQLVFLYHPHEPETHLMCLLHWDTVSW